MQRFKEKVSTMIKKTAEDEAESDDSDSTAVGKEPFVLEKIAMQIPRGMFA